MFPGQYLEVGSHNTLYYAPSVGELAEAPTVTATADDGTVLMFGQTPSWVEPTEFQIGRYQLVVLPEEVPVTLYTPQLVEVVWTWSYNGQVERDVEKVSLVSTSDAPLYSAASEVAKSIISATVPLFMDLFDSDTGGPWLLETSKLWSDDRWVQLLSHAIDKHINYVQPISDYTIDSFPARFAGVAVQALKVEVIRHLMRSYVEQPNREGVSVPRVSRRDYVSRWEAILQPELEELKTMVVMMKRAVRGGRVMNKMLLGGPNFPRYDYHVRPSAYYRR